jgi:putative transcriptional regulator
MIPADLEALALADAIGALDVDEQRLLHARVAALPADLQAQVTRLYDTVLTVGAAAPVLEPPPHVRLQLLTQIAAPSRFTVTADEAEWKESGLSGLTMRILAVDRVRGTVTMLIRGEAGAVYPAHRHTGPEECYIISGTVVVDGRTLGPGDFHHADADSDHGELVTPTGAEVLIVGAIADYLGNS